MSQAPPSPRSPSSPSGMPLSLTISLAPAAGQEGNTGRGGDDNNSVNSGRDKTTILPPAISPRAGGLFSPKQSVGGHSHREIAETNEEMLGFDQHALENNNYTTYTQNNNNNNTSTLNSHRQQQLQTHAQTQPYWADIAACLTTTNTHPLLNYLKTIPIHERHRVINSCDEQGNSALFYCLMPTHAALLQLLLDYGADVNHANDKRNTALHICVFYNYRKTIQTLIENNAALKPENWEHQQPHQLLKSTEKIQQMQNFCNQCYEGYMAHKQPHHSMVPIEKSYYRALFDIGDTEGLGVLTYTAMEAIIRKMIREKEELWEKQHPKPYVRNTIAERERIKLRQQQEEKQQVVGSIQATPSSSPEQAITTATVAQDTVFQWFNRLDTDHNGVISFQEFLIAMVAWRTEQDGEKAKKGKGKKSKKTKPKQTSKTAAA